jgi:hypothetical protein
MQGKESDKKDIKLSVLLALCILFALIAAGLVSCGNNQWEKEEREYAKKRDSYFQYKEGDVVYLKPDSIIGVITDRTLWSKDRLEYRIRYSTKVGKIEYIDILEPSIFNKKQ